MLITIVGVGALGSHLVQLIRNEKVDIRVVDFDRVEQKNVASQFHGKAGVGKTKVEALRQAMDFLFKRSIQTNSNKVVHDNVAQVLAGSDLVVDCLDNGASRRLIQDYVRKNNIPCLHGALAAGGEFGRVIWDEHFVVDDEPAGGAPTCEDGEFLPFIAIVSAYLAFAVKAFVVTKQTKKVGFSISPGGTIQV